MDNRAFTILIAILCSFLFSKEEYNHIYLMEFENVNSDFTINNLSKALPDIVIENYEFRGDLSVEYLKTIDPYIPDANKDVKNNALIVNGRFLSNDNDIDIEIELYDLSTWELLGKKSFYCSIEDMACIHDAFLITIEKMLSKHIMSEEIMEFEIGKNITKKIIYSKDEQIDNSAMFKEALSINAANAEFNINLTDKQNLNGSVVDEEIYREFDFSSNKGSAKDPIEVNTAKITDILNQFLTNPYNVIIGEIDIMISEYDTDMLDFTIPIEFSINKDLVDALLSDIPNTITHRKDGNLSIEFSNENFMFDRLLITKLATMKYQIIPIYSFINKNDEIQLLIVDTWEKKYKDLLIGENKIIHTNQYTPLFAIKSDSYNIHINLEVNTSVINYSFSVPYNTFGNYTKLVVKFMGENELDQYLNIQYGDNN